MKKFQKIISLIFLGVTLSGCNVTYNLNIKSDDNLKFSENIVLSSESIVENENFQEEKIPTPAYKDSMVPSESIEKIEGFEYYDRKLIENNGLRQITFDYTFEKDFENAMSANVCYTIFNFQEKGNSITLSTSKNVNCFETYNNINNLLININVDNVLNHNADEVSNNIYTWRINKDNYTNKPIYLNFEKTKKTINQNNKNTNPINKDVNNKNNNTTFYIFIAILVIILSIGLLFVKIKNNKNNSL